MIMDFKILFGLFSFLVYKKSMFFVEIKENRKSWKKEKSFIILSTENIMVEFIYNFLRALTHTRLSL